MKWNQQRLCDDKPKVVWGEFFRKKKKEIRRSEHDRIQKNNLYRNERRIEVSRSS